MTDYCLHNIYDCTEAYNTNYDSEYVSTVFIEQTSKHWTENALDISLGLLGTTLILQFGLVFYSIYKSFKSHIKPRSKLDVPADKKIKIIRGVPGIGKRNYVYYLENGLNREFIICDWNDFFIKKGKYNFVGKDTTKAENYCLKVFLNSIKQDIKRIYVIGNFSEKWQYENYLIVGKLAGYETSITELTCDNFEELKYFNSRSVHSIPLTKSIKLFENWEKDKSAYHRRPYFSDEKALEFACLIQSSSDEDESKEKEDTDSNLDENESDFLLPSNSTFDNPQSREVTFVTADELKKIIDNYKSNELSDEVSEDVSEDEPEEQSEDESEDESEDISEDESEESFNSDSDYVQSENTHSEQDSDTDTKMNNQKTIVL